MLLYIIISSVIALAIGFILAFLNGGSYYEKH